MQSIGYAFRVAPNTVSKIVHETCKKIWLKLKDLVLPVPDKDGWMKIAEEFETIWNFPHCIGAILGNIFKCLVKLSLYVSLQFILVDVEAEGRCSDAGVFANSALKARFEENTLNVPSPSKLASMNCHFF